MRLQIDERVLDLALLGDAVGVLVSLEVRGDLGVRDRHTFLELVGGERDYSKLDLLVTAIEFGGHIGIGDRDPVGERALQLLENDAAPHLFFELARIDRRVLHLQQLAVTCIADEMPVFLERGQRENPGADFGVAGRDVLPAGLRKRGLLLDELLNDPLVDPQLLQQAVVHVAAVGVAVGLHLLLVDAPEPANRNIAALDRRDDAILTGTVERRAPHETGDVERYERDHHNCQAPLEPVLVPAHPIEHRHGKRASFRKTGNLDYARVYGRSCCSAAGGWLFAVAKTHGRT